MASDSCTDVLDHPEVLDRENLIEVLHQRCIPLHEISSLDKEELVLLFYKYVSPLPQRLHQLRRAKREPPKSAKNIESSSFSVNNQSRKRLQDNVLDNRVSKVKIPKSDLEHVLINNGPSKTKSITCDEPNTVAKLKQSAEIKSKPVKLNRKSLNLDLSSPGNSSPPVMNNKLINSSRQEKSNNQLENPLKLVSKSNNSSDDVKETKQKFQKIAISWP